MTEFENNRQEFPALYPGKGVFFMGAKYLVIAQELERQLRLGLAEGQKLPTEAALCRQYECSRQTVRSALDILKEKGLIRRRQGSGSYPTQSAAGTSRRIALVLSHKEEYLSPSLLQDVAKAAADAGFSVTCLETGGSREEEALLLEKLLRQRPAGILLEPITDLFGCFHPEQLFKLRSAGIPLVWLNGRYDHSSPEVCIDESMAAGILMNHLASTGNRRVAAILKSDDSRGPERFRLLSRCAGELGIRFSDENCLWYSRQERLHLLEGDDSLLRRFQSSYRRDCSAVICFSDEIAYRLQKHLRSIHAEMQILSYDNSYLAVSQGAALSSLGYDGCTPGSAAVQLILRQLDGHPVQDALLPCRLYARKSG